jgi:hypothetical protein
VLEENVLPKLGGIKGSAFAINVPDIIPDDWLERNRDKIDAAVEEAMRLKGITDDINAMFEGAIVSSLSSATQALTDCIAGIEGADASQVLSALMQPFADTMISLGEMLIAEGIAIKAFKESLKSLNPYVAIGAGVALLAVGAALSSGIKALANKSGAGGGSGSSYGGGSSATGSSNLNYENTLTVNVVGKISGSDIALSLDRTRNKQNR